MKILKVLVCAVLFGLYCWFSYDAGFKAGYAVRVKQVQPLKVTILDDGGADIKVESSVVPACK